MNVAHLIRVAEAIEADADLADRHLPARGFNLDHYYAAAGAVGDDPEFDDDAVRRFARGDCGTTACIAGYAADVTGAAALGFLSASGAYDTAVEFLDLTEREAERLFFAESNSVWARLARTYDWNLTSRGALNGWSQITARQAAAVLRLIATGKLRL